MVTVKVLIFVFSKLKGTIIVPIIFCMITIVVKLSEVHTQCVVSNKNFATKFTNKSMVHVGGHDMASGRLFGLEH